MNVTLQNREKQTVTVVNLHSSFSLNKESMFNKNTRGVDTMQQRLADIEHDYNGPASQQNKFYDCISQVSSFGQTLNPQLVDSLQRA